MLVLLALLISRNQGGCIRLESSVRELQLRVAADANGRATRLAATASGENRSPVDVVGLTAVSAVCGV